MITIKEMAEKLGVSSTTVSNVIHGKGSQVSKETIDKVKAIVKEHKYIPNMSARALAQKSSNIIGVILRYPEINDRNAMEAPFYGEIIGSVEHDIRKLGYNMMLHCPEDTESIINFTASWNVDGLIILCLGPEDCQQIRQSTNKPIIFIDSFFFDDGLQYYNVGLEDKRGGYDMTNYLISQGHKNILFVPGFRTGSDEERRIGYVQAMEESGLPYDRDVDITLGISQEDMIRGFEKLLDRKDDYSAFFFSSDYFAVNGINFFKDRGIDVPGRISISGFDDNIFSRITHPRLTTVKQDPKLKGQLAVENLKKLIDKEPLDNRSILLPTELKIRETVKNIR